MSDKWQNKHINIYKYTPIWMVYAWDVYSLVGWHFYMQIHTFVEIVKSYDAQLKRTHTEFTCVVHIRTFIQI